MKKAPKEFIEFMRNEMEKRNLGFREAARMIGVSHPLISDIISYGKKPSFDTCIAIAKAFGYPGEVVLRKAGLLPTKPGMNSLLEECIFIFDSLPESDREEILEIARLKLSLKERRGEYEAGKKKLDNHAAETGSQG